MNNGIFTRKHLALFMTDFSGGGIQRALINLASDFAARGHRVDLIVYNAKGPFLEQVPPKVNIVSLRPNFGLQARLCVLSADQKVLKAFWQAALLPNKLSSSFPYLLDLMRYLRQELPDALLTHHTLCNLMALLAKRLAGVATQVVVTAPMPLSNELKGKREKKWLWRFIPQMIHQVYPWSTAIVSVSNGVANDLAAVALLPRMGIRTIYNPVVTPELREKAHHPLCHPWFLSGTPPVIIGAGRLKPTKGFQTLLRAFACLRTQQKLRLMILGEGKEQPILEDLTRKLGIMSDVEFPGWVPNPFAYMARASVFVLSSISEGFGNVLVEAMACGCPVVSTDCPSGPSEILANGKFGPLTPVGDHKKLAECIQTVLKNPLDQRQLQARADKFSVKYTADQYLACLLREENLVTYP